MGSDHAAMGLSFLPSQALLPDHPPPPPSLPAYTIDDAVRERWVTSFCTITCAPILLTSPNDIDANSLHLLQCIEATSSTTFKPRKPYSPKAARWWNEDCQATVTTLHNADSVETRKTANKALRVAISSAKRKWANKLLEGATTATLWHVAQWRHGCRAHAIPTLTTDVGLSNDTAVMTTVLKCRFFNDIPPVVPLTFDDNPAPLLQRIFHPIIDSEIADTLAQMSNQSAPGKSGHGYKLIKWAWEATPECITTLFNSCCHGSKGPWLEVSFQKF